MFNKMFNSKRRFSSGVLLALLGAGLLLTAPSAHAFSDYVTLWQAAYPASQSDDNAGCVLCHNDTNLARNPYGADWRAAWPSASPTGPELTAALRAIEGIDSDSDPTGSSNIVEINADTQPGWAEGSNPAGVSGDLDPIVVIPEPNIAVDPTALNFSTVTVGSSSTLTTTVENIGTADLNVSGIVLGSGTSTEFSVSPTTAFTLTPGTTRAVDVTYAPIDIGSDSGSIVINSDDPDTPNFPVAVTGLGAAEPVPDINLVPTSADFGEVLIGETGTQTATIENLGDAALQIGAIGPCTGTSAEFSGSVANSLVPAGGNTTLTVNYLPVDLGTDTGALCIASDDADEPVVEFGVTGTGTEAAIPDIALDPTALDFGALLVGDSSTLTAQIRNVGSADLTVTGVALAAGTSGDFALTPFSTPVIIGPGGSASVDVTYSPSDVGPDSGAVVISSDDPDEPEVSLALSGSGSDVPPPPEPDINLDPATLDFGTVTIGNTESLTTAVQNLGAEPLTVTMINRCSSTTTEFGWNPSSFSVPAGSSVNLTVSYTPVDVGSDAGCLAITSNDPDEPVVELGVAGAGQESQGTADVIIQAPRSIRPDSVGMIAVKFYATDADVIVEKVRCGRDDEQATRISYEDFNIDGFVDSVGIVEIEDLAIECGDTTFECSGMLEDGTEFSGTSNVFRTFGTECISTTSRSSGEVRSVIRDLRGRVR